jgi:O-antigen/teichoic acid export membrane protein
MLLWLVPVYGYEGAAWAHLVTYGSMVVASYVLGRRYYPVPYDLKRVLGYIGLGLALYGAGRLLTDGLGLHGLIAGTLCLALYLALVFLLDGRALLRRASA